METGPDLVEIHMKPFSSIFTGERGGVLSVIGIALIVAISVFVTALIVTNNGSRPVEADSVAAPAAHIPQDPFSSNSVYVRIDANGEFLEGESLFSDREVGGWTDVLEYNHSVTGATDTSSGLRTGRLLHNAIVITKRIDQSSPLLFDAMVQNKTVDAIFEFERASQIGDPEVYYTVELSDARITGVRKNVGLFGGDTEAISIAYGGISEVNESNGAVVEIDVRTGVR